MLIQIDDNTVIDFGEIASIKEECLENELFTHTVFTLKSGVQVYSDTPMKGVLDVLMAYREYFSNPMHAAKEK